MHSEPLGKVLSSKVIPLLPAGILRCEKNGIYWTKSSDAAQIFSLVLYCYWSSAHNQKMLYLPKIDGKIYCCMIRKHVCMCNCVDVAIWALVLSSWLKMSAFGVESFYTAFMIQGNRYLPKEVNNLVFRLIDPFFGDFLLPLPWQHRGVYFVPTLTAPLIRTLNPLFAL